MPANKNAMTRYKILDELLSSRYHNCSLDDLTEEVSNRLADIYPDTNGVVRRTIEKDIYYLEYEGPFMVEFERCCIGTIVRRQLLVGNLHIDILVDVVLVELSHNE